MFKVEVGHPVPDVMDRVFYPFATMNPGDSFELTREQLPRARAAASAYGRRHGQRFATYKQSSGLWRLWRVE